ncbi:MAG: glycosyltransferase family 2 protein [Gammaproteobacteria bacterium]
MLEKITAVIVTYFPDISALSSLFMAIKDQVGKIVVIDNGSTKKITAEIRRKLPANAVLIPLETNAGVAAALNKGISQAGKWAAEYVLLLDQDSVPEGRMAKNLLSALNRQRQAGFKVAAVGPNYSDSKVPGVSPFVKLNKIKLSRVECRENEIVPVDHLITSGSLIPIGVIEEVGEMEERLFIDYVDTEWCLRAIRKRYRLYGVCSARMRHNLGDEVAELFGMKVFVRAPIRYYYLIRNGIWLMRRPWVSNSWRMMDLCRLVQAFIAFSLFVGKKNENLKMMALGIWHGLNGRMGRYEEK